MSGRSPDEILDELGVRLRAAAERDDAETVRAAERGTVRSGRSSAARRGPGRRRSARWAIRHRALLLAAVLGALAVASTAVATGVLWAPSPPRLLDEGADAVSRPAFVAAGGRGLAAWRLSARTCRFGARRAVTLTLHVRNGGAGRSCDGPPPAGARLETYFDAEGARTFFFAVLPERAAAVRLRASGYALGSRGYAGRRTLVWADAATVAASADAVGRAGIPAKDRFVVVAVPGQREIREAVVRDATGREVTRCGRGGACR